MKGEAKGWLLVCVKEGRGASPKVLPSRAEAVEAARLFAKGCGATGWAINQPVPGVVVVCGQEGGGWCCFITACVAPVAAPKRRKARAAAAAPASAATPTAHVN